MENGIEISCEIFERYVKYNVQLAIKSQTRSEMPIMMNEITVDVDFKTQQCKGAIGESGGVKLLFGDFYRSRQSNERTFRVQCFVVPISCEKLATIPKIGVDSKLE